VRTACAALAPVASSPLVAMAQVALLEQARAGDRFRRWAAKRCPDARLMNVGSDLQIRQLLFGGKPNCKDKDQSLPHSRVFKVSSPPREQSHSDSSRGIFFLISLMGLVTLSGVVFAYKIFENLFSLYELNGMQEPKGLRMSRRACQTALSVYHCPVLI
jgi:hypothetical protein